MKINQKKLVYLLIASSFVVSLIFVFVIPDQVLAIVVYDGDNCPITNNCNTTSIVPDISSGFCFGPNILPPTICQELCSCSPGTCAPGSCPYNVTEWSCYNTIYTGTCQSPDAGICGDYECGEAYFNQTNTSCIPTGGSPCERVGGGGGSLTALCSPSSQSAGVGASVNVTGSASGGNTPYTYSWSASGGSTTSGSGTAFSTSYSSTGTKTISLTVQDNSGSTDNAQCIVNVGGGGGGGGSVTLGPLDAKVQKAGVGPYQDSYTGSAPLSIDVSETFNIVSGCNIGSTCDIRYRVDCLNDGSFDDSPSSGYQNQTNSPPAYTMYIASSRNHCTYSSPGSYTLRARAEVWPQSNPADITWIEDIVPITISAPGPTVTLNASPTSVTVGQSSTLTWSSTDTTACFASGGWSGAKGVSGSESTGPLNTNKIYTLTCTGPGGSAQDTAAVTVDGPNPDISVAITAVNNSGSFDLRDVKNTDRLTFQIVYRNSGSGTATNVHNVEINVSNNHQIQPASVVCPNCSGPPASNQQISFNRNSNLTSGQSFTVQFDTIVSTGVDQPLEILTVSTTGEFNPGPIPFDEIFALIAGSNRDSSPGFHEVAP